MSQNYSTPGAIAPLQNLTLVSQALEKSINRRDHLPGIIGMFGPAGIGKTWAAIYGAHKYRAYYVEAKDYWTKKAFLKALLKEMGIPPETTIPDMADQIAEQLAKSGRPLIIDECDYIIEKKLVEMVRSIYEGSQAPILMIGEENLPTKLLKHSERFHSRVLSWVPAAFPNYDDAETLCQLYVHDVEIHAELLKLMMASINPSIRRITVNLEKIREHALEQGLKTIGVEEWQGQEFDTGKNIRRDR